MPGRVLRRGFKREGLCYANAPNHILTRYIRIYQVKGPHEGLDPRESMSVTDEAVVQNGSGVPHKQMKGCTQLGT